MTVVAYRKLDQRSVQTLARTLVRDLRTNGLEERDLIAVAAEIVGQVADQARRRQKTVRRA